MTDAVEYVGLEPDRVAPLAGQSPDRPKRRIWNVSEYAIQLRGDPDLRNDDAFVAAEREALAALAAADVWDPQGWVFNRVARAVGEGHGLAPVTDDFVVFSFADDFGSELRANLRFSGGPATDLLEQRERMPGVENVA